MLNDHNGIGTNYCICYCCIEIMYSGTFHSVAYVHFHFRSSESNVEWFNSEQSFGKPCVGC